MITIITIKFVNKPFLYEIFWHFRMDNIHGMYVHVQFFKTVHDYLDGERLVDWKLMAFVQMITDHNGIAFSSSPFSCRYAFLGGQVEVSRMITFHYCG